MTLQSSNCHLGGKMAGESQPSLAAYAVILGHNRSYPKNFKLSGLGATLTHISAGIPEIRLNLA